MQNEILALIDNVQEQADIADIAVFGSLVNCYTKSLMVSEQCENAESADMFLEAFDPKSVDNSAYEKLKDRTSETESGTKEMSKLDKFKKDLDGPVLGSKDESIGKRIAMALPRLIKKLIELFKKLIDKLKKSSNNCKKIADDFLKAYDKMTPEQKTEFRDTTCEPELYYFAAKNPTDIYVNFYLMHIPDIVEALKKDGVYKFREEAGSPSIPNEKLIESFDTYVHSHEMSRVKVEITQAVEKLYKVNIRTDADPITRKGIAANYPPKKTSIPGTEILGLMKTLREQGSKVYDDLHECGFAVFVLLEAINTKIAKLAEDRNLGGLVGFTQYLTTLHMWLNKYKDLFDYMLEHDQMMIYEATKQSLVNMDINFGIKRIDKFAKQSERERWDENPKHMSKD